MNGVNHSRRDGLIKYIQWGLHGVAKHGRNILSAFIAYMHCHLTGGKGILLSTPPRSGALPTVGESSLLPDGHNPRLLVHVPPTSSCETKHDNGLRDTVHGYHTVVKLRTSNQSRWSQRCPVQQQCEPKGRPRFGSGAKPIWAHVQSAGEGCVRPLWQSKQCIRNTYGRPCTHLGQCCS